MENERNPKISDKKSGGTPKSDHRLNYTLYYEKS